MKRKILYGLVAIALLIGVLSVSVIETGDSTAELQNDKVVNTDGQLNETIPTVNVKYEINEGLANVTVFGNYLNRNRLLWATYDENDRLTNIDHKEIFAYPFKYQGKMLNQYNRLIIWNDETNGPLINKVITNEDK